MYYRQNFFITTLIITPLAFIVFLINPEINSNPIKLLLILLILCVVFFGYSYAIYKINYVYIDNGKLIYQRYFVKSEIKLDEIEEIGYANVIPGVYTTKGIALKGKEKEIRIELAGMTKHLEDIFIEIKKENPDVDMNI